MSRKQLARLEMGETTNPTLRVVQGLSTALGITPAEVHRLIHEEVAR